MTLKQKRIEWESRIEAWKESGQSVSQWCQEHDLKSHQMYYWIQRLEHKERQGNDSNTGTQWLTLQIEDDQAALAKGSIIIHLGPTSIEIQPGADIKLLSEVVSVLQNQC
ncbi:IS66 family insertion sequence element accessory protein TnpB [Paraliobacillus sp. JSM ZJ581]|uniref:IS66 family insertion sequence element accessory protein TnpA n=1 Tax=Paraliobacillus sp. JSM ZJ581 TaxID=3342118 RepID=UPI0035A8B112